MKKWLIFIGICIVALLGALYFFYPPCGFRSIGYEFGDDCNSCKCTILGKEACTLKRCVKLNLQDMIRESGQLLYWRKSLLEISKSVPTTEIYGVTQNGEDQGCYVVYVQCNGRVTEDGCGPNTPIDTVIGGQASKNLIKLQSPILLRRNDTQVYNMTFQMTDFPIDTYQLVLRIAYNPSDTSTMNGSYAERYTACTRAAKGAVDESGTLAPGWKEYAPSHVFFVEIK